MINVSAETPIVLYIAGSGRNGSTFLGLQLERSRQICFAGELTHIWNRGYLNNELCGCGEPFRSCEFWTEVTKAAFGVFTSRDARQALWLRNRSSRFLNLPLLLLSPDNVPLQTGRQYGQLYKQLVQAVSVVSGRSHIVDSSKYPTDLAVLRKLSGVTIKTLHLIRNCNAVVYSWKRKKQRTEIHWKNQLMPRYGAIQTALGWKVFNRTILAIAGQSPAEYQRVRYEDLTSGFEDVMQQLFRWAGCEPGDPSAAFTRNSHSVSGNPCRFNFRPQQIQTDMEWRSRMRVLDRIIVRALCSRDQRMLGYGD